VNLVIITPFLDQKTFLLHFFLTMWSIAQAASIGKELQIALDKNVAPFGQFASKPPTNMDPIDTFMRFSPNILCKCQLPAQLTEYPNGQKWWNCHNFIKKNAKVRCSWTDLYQPPVPTATMDPSMMFRVSPHGDMRYPDPPFGDQDSVRCGKCTQTCNYVSRKLYHLYWCPTRACQFQLIEFRDANTFLDLAKAILCNCGVAVRVIRNQVANLIMGCGKNPKECHYQYIAGKMLLPHMMRELDRLESEAVDLDNKKRKDPPPPPVDDELPEEIKILDEEEEKEIENIENVRRMRDKAVKALTRAEMDLERKRAEISTRDLTIALIQKELGAAIEEKQKADLAHRAVVGQLSKKREKYKRVKLEIEKAQQELKDAKDERRNAIHEAMVAEDRLKRTEESLNKMGMAYKTAKLDLDTLKSAGQLGDKDQIMCKVCMENLACVFTLPCQHMVMCWECLNNNIAKPGQPKTCPICKQLISVEFKVYLS
jgi:hypothetical protein